MPSPNALPERLCAYSFRIAWLAGSSRYRRYVYEHGAQASKGIPIGAQLLDREAQKGFALTPVDRLRYRTRYFTDGGVIGTKTFVSRCATLFETHFSSRHAKRPRPIAGLAGVYSLKRLSETR